MTPSKSNEGPVSDDTIIKFCHNIVPEKFDENDDMYRELVFETLFRMLAHRRIKIVEKKLEKIATAA